MPARPHANPHLKPLEQALAARFGWQTNASWRDGLLDAIRRKSEKLGMDPLAYSRMAVASPGELDALADLLINSETRFFREPDQFEALARNVIPELIEKRGGDRRIDVWSAACSTGEEAYSLAILLTEALKDKGQWKVNLLATDLRGSAIISAGRASYAAASLRLISPELRERYFVGAGVKGVESSFDVIQPLRGMVAFRRANLYDAGFWKNMGQRFDLIVCNNLLLYFHALAVKQTLDRIAGVLKPGGFLMVMKNETGYVEHPQLKREESLPGSFFKKV